MYLNHLIFWQINGGNLLQKYIFCDFDLLTFNGKVMKDVIVCVRGCAHWHN